MTVTDDQFLFLAVGFALVVVVPVVLLWLAAASRRRIRGGQAGDPMERMDALFRASFPELQPHFHPARVHEFVRLRRGQKAPSGPTTWRKPAGFPAADAATITPDGLKDRVRLVDAAGRAIAEFVYEEHPEGAVIRMGKGKFTVNVKGPEPRVRYWHPQREFKWTPRTWKINAGMADQPLESRDTSSGFGDSSSSSSSPSSFSRGSAAAAAAGGIVAAGGAFDGGGASQGWDQGGDGSSGDASGGGDESVAAAAGDSGGSDSGGSGADTSTSTGY